MIRSGVALESLDRARTMVIDKTGTLSAGRPVVVETAAAPGWDAGEVLRLAASADQLSPHVLAEAIVAEAHARGLLLAMPTDVSELLGRGVAATIGQLRVEVGKQQIGADSPDCAHSVLSRATLDGSKVTWLTVDGALAGAALLRDPLRPDAHRTVRRLRVAGLKRLVMLTGDRGAPAQEIGSAVGLDEIRAE